MELCHINNKNRQQIKSGEYLLPFHPESSFLLFPAKETKGSGENCIMMIFMICVSHQMLLEWSNQGGWIGEEGSTHQGAQYRVLVERPEINK